MKTDWIPTSKALPPDGSVVEFVLDHRDMAMSGTYRQRRFASRWSEYEMTAVREWRPASTVPCPASSADQTRAVASSQVASSQ